MFGFIFRFLNSCSLPLWIQGRVFPTLASLFLRSTWLQSLPFSDVGHQMLCLSGEEFWFSVGFETLDSFFLSLYLCVGLCSLPLFLFCLLLIINVVQAWCYDVYADIQVHMCILHCKITRLMQEQNIIDLTNTLLFGLRLWFKKPFLWFHKLQVIIRFHWKVWGGCGAT